MINVWDTLEHTLAKFAEPVQFWWRDDDAVEESTALNHLIDLQQRYNIALHLAVIPHHLKSTLLDSLSPHDDIWVLQHGFSHQSYAAPQQRKIELGGECDPEQLRKQLAQGKHILEHAFPKQFLPIMVPPWNRVDDWVHPLLQSIGYSAWSGLASLSPSLNTKNIVDQLDNYPVHIDIMNWKTRQFAGVEIVVNNIIQHLEKQRLSTTSENKAIGLMTHHLVHDTSCQQFLDQFFAFSQTHSMIEWQNLTHLNTANKA